MDAPAALPIRVPVEEPPPLHPRQQGGEGGGFNTAAPGDVFLHGPVVGLQVLQNLGLARRETQGLDLREKPLAQQTVVRHQQVV